MNTRIDERGRHKAGCGCGFCKNMGSFGKKKDEPKDEADDDKKPANEARTHIRGQRPAKLSDSRRATSIVSSLLED